MGAAKAAADALEEIAEAVLDALNIIKQWALSKINDIYTNLFEKIDDFEKDSLTDDFNPVQCAHLFGLATSFFAGSVFVGFVLLLCLVTVKEMSEVFVDAAVTIIGPSFEEPEGALAASAGAVFAYCMMTFALFYAAYSAIDSCTSAAEASSNSILAPILLLLALVDVVLFLYGLSVLCS